MTESRQVRRANRKERTIADMEREGERLREMLTKNKGAKISATYLLSAWEKAIEIVRKN